jgi:trans-aconitate methyltransferase
VGDHDHGAGTGVVTGLVHERWPGTRVLALDPDAGMLNRLTARFGDAAWLEVLSTTLRDAGSLGPFDACLSNLVLQVTVDPLDDL